MRTLFLPITLFAAAGLTACATSPRAEPSADAAQAPATDGAQNWQPSWPGTAMAVLKGRPSVGGEWTFQFRMPAGYWIHPHRHPVDAHIRVIFGTFLAGHGDRLDSTRVRALGPGRTITIDRGMAHFEGTRGETIIEVSGSGQWGIEFLDPTKDPARR